MKSSSGIWTRSPKVWSIYQSDIREHIREKTSTWTITNVSGGTGILLRFLLRNDSAYPVVRQAVRNLKTLREQLVTTPQNIAEFWNVCTRPASARGGLGLSVEATERRVRLLEHHFRVLHDSPAIYHEWRALVVAHNVMGVQVHDARIIAAMKVHGVARILTLNVADFIRYPGITAIAPEDVT